MGTHRRKWAKRTREKERQRESSSASEFVGVMRTFNKHKIPNKWFVCITNYVASRNSVNFQQTSSYIVSLGLDPTNRAVFV